MTDKPIIFSAPMIRALWDGRKTQTRRMLKLRGHRTFSEFGPSDTTGYDWHFRDSEMRWHDYRHADLLRLLPYAPGDRLWVREAWNVPDAYLLPENRETALGLMNYRATPWAEPGAWRSPIHMPRWASRLTLTVTDVRVQRVQEISAEDCAREGVVIPDSALIRDGFMLAARNHFRDLWNSIHGPKPRRRAGGTLSPRPGIDTTWDANPWVCALTFTVHQQNIEGMA